MADLTRIFIPEAPLPTAEQAEAARATRSANKAAAAAPVSGASFSEMLRVQQGIAPAGGPPAAANLGGLRFSAHAQTRMQSRQIDLQPDQIERLQNAVQQAASKGSRDSLVLMDNLAMVVSIKNRTVVTVVDRDNLKQNVFTNIDSAVIA
jgi:flagellar operon protein